MNTRLIREIKEVGKIPPESGIRLIPDPNDIYKWRAVLKGPQGTPFEGGEFDVTLSVPSAYPMSPPTARYNTKIFHPNVHFKTGEICLDILKTAWSPAWTLQSVCQAIMVMLSAPEPDSPLNCDAGNLLRAGDTKGYWSMARMYTIEYAMK